MVLHDNILFPLFRPPGATQARRDGRAGVPGRRVRVPRALRRGGQAVSQGGPTHARHEHVHRPPHVRLRKGKALYYFDKLDGVPVVSGVDDVMKMR